ncbi:MAG: tail protein X [Lachnospiraceae bacterium]|nr:tail protein X [Lachnospiraceae bacterium]
MASTYTTVQGDTWDLMAYKLYGDEKYMKNLAEANWPLLDVLIFAGGVEITVPDLPEEVDTDAPFWREDDTEDGGTSSDTVETDQGGEEDSETIEDDEDYDL